MSGELFMSNAAAYDVDASKIEVEARSGGQNRPFMVKLGNLVIFMSFDVLDSLVTQGGFARERYLREQTKCESCRGTGMTGHAESPDSCQVCRGTGIGGA